MDIQISISPQKKQKQSFGVINIYICKISNFDRLEINHYT